MKTTKKLLGLFLAALLVFSLIVTNIVSANIDIPQLDETKPYIKATATPVKAGEIAKITFTIGNNPKFWGMYQTYKFDPNVFSFVEGETNSYGTFPKFDRGTGFKNSLISPINADGEFTFIFTEIYNDQEIKSNGANGEIFSIYLKIAENAPQDSYNIEMVDYSPENYLGISGKTVDFTFNQPTVEVLEGPSSSETESTEPSTQKPTQSTTAKPAPTAKPSQTVKPTTCVHTTTVKGAIAATCFADGYTGDKICVKCNKTITKGSKIAKLTLKTPTFKLTKGKKQFKVKYTAVSGATGFQVKYKAKGKWKTKTYKTTKTVTKTIKKLKKGTYKVQVRALAKGSTTIYSSWAKVKKVKVK